MPRSRAHVVVISLEMRAPPTAPPPPPPRPDATIARWIAPDVDDYLALYRAVGERWSWVDRLRMPRDRLTAILGDPRVEVHVLRLGDEPAGYFELDRRVPGEVELAYFGLVPGAIGQGLGRLLLARAVNAAWTGATRRLWVHTCTLDGPAALPCYRRGGFVEFAREHAIQPL
jgi:GNAT superfamily N-acetyltransferase